LCIFTNGFVEWGPVLWYNLTVRLKRKELNKVSWNDREAKYDIRDWSPDHEKMGKGVTLSDEEFKKLKELLGGGKEG